MGRKAKAEQAVMQRVLARLQRAYGRRRWRRWGTPVAVLVETILSQNTSDVNSSAGYRRLRRRFRRWEQVADAPVGQVEESIRVCGLSRIKAPRIQNILGDIRRDRGKIDLSFLGDLPAEEALAYLRRFKGVGPKTANCVLLFSLMQPVFPVDTHIQRIAARLGLTPARASAEQVEAALTPMIAPPDRYETHVLLIAHGRRTCRAHGPLCEWCCLADLCPYPQRA